MAGKVQRELLDKEGYWLAGKEPVMAVGREDLEIEVLGDDKQVGQVVDIVDCMFAGIDHQEVADKG